MADENISDETWARSLMNDFVKPQGHLLKYQCLYPNLHYNICNLLDKVKALYSEINQTTDITNIDIKWCVTVLMASIPKIKSKCEYKANLENTYSLLLDSEEKLSSNLSEVHSWYFRSKVEVDFLELNPFPLANSAQQFGETMSHWAECEDLYQVLGKFSSAQDVLYKSIVSTDPHPRVSFGIIGGPPHTDRIDRWRPPATNFPTISENLGPTEVHRLMEAIGLWFQLGGEVAPSQYMIYSILRNNITEDLWQCLEHIITPTNTLSQNLDGL